jgi:hypothetical protein
MSAITISEIQRIAATEVLYNLLKEVDNGKNYSTVKYDLLTEIHKKGTVSRRHFHFIDKTLSECQTNLLNGKYEDGSIGVGILTTKSSGYFIDFEDAFKDYLKNIH